MSYDTISKAFIDTDLINRVRAAVAKEAFANETLKATDTGRMILKSGPDSVLPKFLWPLCIATEAEYAYALDIALANPGRDPGVVSDGAIASSVQANWPTDEELLPRTYYLRVVEAGLIPT